MRSPPTARRHNRLDSVDPREPTPLDARHATEGVRVLQAGAVRKRQEIQERLQDRRIRQVEIDPELRRQLESLGYVR